jgi:site-specific DNA-cytosine methylase
MTLVILNKVRERIQQNKLTHDDAAAQIGVTTQSLAKHLSGGYVRSDSVAKYRLWLEQDVFKGTKPQTHQPIVAEHIDGHDSNDVIKAIAPRLPVAPYRVVDVFSGCGAMSIGFDRHFGGHAFRTVLAIDVEEPMVRVFNDNHSRNSAELPIGRQVDMTDFLNETEVRAFYLDHLSRSGQDEVLTNELQNIAGHDLGSVRAGIHLLDQQFLDALATIRTDSDYLASYRKLGSDSLSQTSVVGFHRALRLPMAGLSTSALPPLLWHNDGTSSARPTVVPEPHVLSHRRAYARLWASELRRIQERARGEGKGQLSSSAKRIADFISFMSTPAAERIRNAWIDWRARRDAIRTSIFENSNVQKHVERLYQRGRNVSVILGGPPCQGFSRIGRGKIRSLREQSVHVQEDINAVDSRNTLLRQYVLFVSALAPQVFLFENVRHFKAVVGKGKNAFDAAAILEDAISNVSTEGVGYSVESKIIVASRHLVPQGRERFYMAGIRTDVKARMGEINAAAACLELPAYSPVLLETALEGLPEPKSVADTDASPAAVVPVRLNVAQKTALDATTLFRRWISPTGDGFADAHVARPARRDDEAFFELLGPGKRWMDYRCDAAPTLHRLQRAFSGLHKALRRDRRLQTSLGLTAAESEDIQNCLDGSLTIRLLLECIPPLPGETHHHLLTPSYLQKKNGQHGDWLARMDPAKPSKTMVSHMAKDTYAYVHPTRPRTISVREAARIQSFPDDYKLGSVGLVDGFRIVGNAVPPLLSSLFADRVLRILTHAVQSPQHTERSKAFAA